MKILHTADWHLDAPLQGHHETLHRALMAVPGQIFELVRREHCDLVLISGDIFDGAYTAASYQTVCDVLRAMAVPVLVAPGNHDYCGQNSPWVKEFWPENVHIFRSEQIESVAIPSLNCRVYGAGFTGMDCSSLLEGFCADCQERYALGVFHADPTQTRSPYNCVTKAQVQASKLDYLALGHIHKADHFTAGKTLCAWPGCPMGKGYDETGEKGVYIVTLEDTVQLSFVPLETPRFYDLETEGTDLGAVLPPVGNEDFYRITLTGCCEKPDLDKLLAENPQFPNLQLRDRTTRPVDVWGSLGEDTVEGIYFGMLKQAMEQTEGDNREEILLAAQISRQLLDGQEVTLP